jgi:hypothetical protein
MESENSPTYLEPVEKLAAPTQDMHRGLASIIEALHAVDSYTQRYDACTDPELRLIIAHHRDQHKAQAAMLLEWVRRRDVRFDHELKQALFKAGPITAQFKS